MSGLNAVSKAQATVGGPPAIFIGHPTASSPPDDTRIEELQHIVQGLQTDMEMLGNNPPPAPPQIAIRTFGDIDAARTAKQMR
ncbi:hypothetical protein N7461_002323 [Penicillium sp. DV-2018c]|nr:hypothetical protein N7461_002323 [Penicillium sp. DV-2018c]